MDLAKYQKLAGFTVSSGNITKVTATINRTRIMLENMLGFSLYASEVSENFYKELGKTSESCFCSSIDLEDLDDPDEIEGSYRLFKYDRRDKYFFIDPFLTVYKVKQVYIKQGKGNNGVTVKTFDDDEIRLQYRKDWGKYIEYCQSCLCECKCENCVQLAVDADWLNEDCLPLDLQYLWADMISYYADDKHGIKSESIDTHSYTKESNTAPEANSVNLAIIKKYAGPHGSVMSNPT